MKRTLLTLDNSIKAKAKMKAQLLGMSLHEYISRLIELDTKDIKFDKYILDQIGGSKK